MNAPDFEEEVLFIAEAVGDSFDDLDLVVDTFQPAGVKRPNAVGEDAPQIGPADSGTAPLAHTPRSCP